MRINADEFVQLKVRFENYLRSVPKELWFAGRRDAPSPARQLNAVQKMFGINCTELGGDPAPASDPRTCFDCSRELRVAVSRLEQWELRAGVLRRRRQLRKLLT